MPDFLTPPDPAGSPLEKLELSRKGFTPRDLGRFLRAEGIDDDTARRMARAVELWERERHFDEVEGLLNLETWANTHTHAAGGGDVSPPGGVNLWTQQADSPVDIRHASACVVGSKIFVTGGQTAGGVTQSIHYELDPATGAMTAKTSLPVARMRHAAFEADGKLYVAGGDDGSAVPVDTTYVYDPGTDSWAAGPTLLYARRQMAVFRSGVGIVLAGGYSGSTGSTSSVAAQVLSGGAWASFADVPVHVVDTPERGARYDGEALVHAAGEGAGTNFVTLADDGTWGTPVSSSHASQPMSTTGTGGVFVLDPSSGDLDFLEYPDLSPTAMSSRGTSPGPFSQFVHYGGSLWSIGGSSTPREVWEYET